MNPVQSSQRRIVLTVLFLLIFGQVMLFSASGFMGIQRYNAEFYFSIRQGACALLGLAMMFLLSRFKVGFWKSVTPYLFAAQLLLIALTLFSPFRLQAQGASRWLNLGGLTLQPSELARISLTFYAGYILSKNEVVGFSYKHWLGHGALIGLLLGMIFKQPDLGTTVLLILVVMGVLFISGIKPLMFLGMTLSGAVALGIAMLSSEYRRRRLAAFLNPWSEPQGSGFQSIQSLLSIHSGKIAGVGIGNGNSKLFYLPEVHTDFIFSLTAEELGFIGVVILLIAFAVLGFLLFRAAGKLSDSYSRYVVFGLSLSLMLQVCVNIGGVTGIIPIKGLPLPFFSWGRSALITHLAMIGIILSLIRGQTGKSMSTSQATIASIQRELLDLTRPRVG